MKIRLRMGVWLPVMAVPFAWVAALAGCEPSLAPVAPGGGGGAGVGKLYVTNSFSNSLLRFNTASTATGDIAPAAVVSGALTTLNNPSFILADIVNNRLYVANTGANSILVFDEMSGKTGNVAPNRTIAGAATTLNGPIDVALDSARNLLFVSNSLSNSILVFEQASSINGNVAPARRLTGSSTGLSFNQGLLLDSLNNRLYVTNQNTNTVTVYDNASTITGNVTPTRTIASASLNQPVSARIDSLGSLLVTNTNSNTLVSFSNASSLTGTVTPARTVSGALTTLNGPDQTIFDATTGVAYVANSVASSVLVFSSIISVNGNVAPTRALSGPLTRLAGPSGVALDTTR